MKKVFNVGLISSVLLGLGLTVSSCDSGTKFEKVSLENIQIGLICLHDDSSSYDANFIDSMYRAMENKGLKEDQLKLSTGIKEDQSCYDEASKMAATCNVVFADSFAHEDYLIQAAQEYPNVRFCHATGTKAHSVGLNNFSNAFASIYEGRYLAGIVAGQKLNEMIDADKITAEQAKIGYVGAYSYAEVISGFTSFYLGAKSVCPTVTMDVKFTGSWYDYDAEESAAKALISNGCVLISGHADSYGAPTACETHKDANEEADPIPNVAYNISTKDKCPNSYLVSSKIDWAPYFEYMIDQVVKGEQIDTDWTGSIETGSVVLTEYGDGVSQTAKNLVEEAKQKLINKTLKVFDTSKFTVSGKTITSYLADVDTDKEYTADTEAIVKDGDTYYYNESAYRSAPYFDIKIDGITWLNSEI